MRSISGIYWEKGRRSLNQDSLVVHQVTTGRGRVILAAVSDGIGGLKEGEVASGYILESIVHSFYEQLLLLIRKRRRTEFFKRCIFRSLEQINRELNIYAREKDIRLGATLSLLLIWKRRYMIVHIGDSRIYLCKRQMMKQLTKDHGLGKGITKCLGSFGFQRPDIRFGRIWGIRGFLLCTDGFYRKMDKSAAGEMLRAGDIENQFQIEKRLQRLGEMAMGQEEKDNLSAVYVKVW